MNGKKKKDNKKFDRQKIGKLMILFAVLLFAFSGFNLYQLISKSAKDKGKTISEDDGVEVEESSDQLETIIAEALREENDTLDPEEGEETDMGEADNKIVDTTKEQGGNEADEADTGNSSLDINTEGIQIMNLDDSTLELLGNDLAGLTAEVQTFANGYGLQAATEANYTGECYLNSHEGTVTVEFRFNNDENTGVEVVYDTQTGHFSAHAW